MNRAYVQLMLIITLSNGVSLIWGQALLCSLATAAKVYLSTPLDHIEVMKWKMYKTPLKGVQIIKVLK